MSYQPRSTNPYIMEKKLNECVGGGGVDPSVLEEIQAEISVLGSENATMAQDIIDIKGSLNAINDNLSKHTISNNNRVALTYGVTYKTLADGYFSVISTDPSPSNYVSIMLSGIEIGRLYKPSSTDAMANTFVRKGSTISFSGSSNSSAYFYPLA